MATVVPKIGIIIPDRGDRPVFMQHCMRMLKAQTMQPAHIHIVNDPPQSDAIDITRRYRMGYDYFRNKGMDALCLIENDDWYRADYLQQMWNAWEVHNRPDIFGHTYTYYYHIGLRRYFTFHHMDRSSAMNSLLKPDLNFNWCAESDPYTDMHLWQTLKGVTWKVPEIICIGIKHGIGMCGGYGHINRFHRYSVPDGGLLQSTVDAESFAFYNSFPQVEQVGFDEYERNVIKAMGGES